MSDEENAKLSRIAADLAENTKQTGRIRALFEIHNQLHKQIDEKLSGLTKDVWGENGLRDQARDCMNQRKTAKAAGASWPIWLGVIGGWVAALAALGLIFKH